MELDTTAKQLLEVARQKKDAFEESTKNVETLIKRGSAPMAIYSMQKYREALEMEWRAAAIAFTDYCLNETIVTQLDTL